jgi:alkylhydroperoxidase/carboxymuconolactone decarboxylase family protein YurZ
MAGPVRARELGVIQGALARGPDRAAATHSHARRGKAEGLSAEEIEHVAYLAITTLGWPQAMRGLTWVRDETRK